MTGDLSTIAAPADGVDGPTLIARRRVLQAIAAGAAVTSLPSWLIDRAGASSDPASGQGTLVLVVMDGGNDGLHMVPPVGAGAYHDARGPIAHAPSSVLDLDGNRGFHPALSRLKNRFDAGDVAVIDGIGNPKVDLSHFSAMADHQHGGPSAGAPLSGWLGRYLDLAEPSAFDAIALGRRRPLVVRGETRSAMTLPVERHRVPARRTQAAQVYSALALQPGVPTGLGPLADRVAAASADVITSADGLRPHYRDPEGGSVSLVDELALCGRLINARLGTRILTVSHGPYDSHTNQLDMHGQRMAELDAGIDALFAELDPDVREDVTVLCVSEFGRRMAVNGGNGTDHGAGNCALAIGRKVRGGFHGNLPSLTSLTQHGNLTHEIDYRSLYATVLDGVLGAEHSTVLGGSFETIDLFHEGEPPAPTTTTTTTAPPPPPPPPPPAPTGRRLTRSEGDVLRLYWAFFNRQPDATGGRYWIRTHAAGHSLDDIAEWFSQGHEFDVQYGGTSNATFVARVYRNVLGRAYDQTGYRYWLDQLNRGRLTRAGTVRWMAAGEELYRRHPYTHAPFPV